MIKMVLQAWETENTRTTKLLSELSDDLLKKEVAPGRNTGEYLLGHLIAVNDGLFQILGMGQRSYSHYDEVFVKNPDKAGLKRPDIAELRQSWQTMNERVSAALKQVTLDAWFSRHMNVSEEDFAREPHRNKLNVLISRFGHHSYHRGQLILLKGNE